ncbi:carboxy-S-adenosyl-L-methionine synthase CmoA [Candidatus Albibeggiatoa sp. nov. NOAA]|uniref:carboxy-S-adenosyl-L-methionine synthase CmoA n=1 Tax=Candidatus Albibeggiatoa sp. nov. NOAA TaxID=3162724 RepID=UPI0032F81E85|nr:carboxy-S-adenosyl-L-methionine synthase CmoA [Thiotrichaceae bacterium]
MTVQKDDIYATSHYPVPEFRFDDKVATVFSDMIQRSVPGYGMIISMLKLLATRYAQADSHLYDLGCSLGAATLALRHGIEQPNCQIIAIDNSEAMTTRCQDNIQADTMPTPVTVQCMDVQEVEIENASIVVLNFTLQFIPAEQRLELLQKIYNGLRPNGLLVLSEKLIFEPEFINQSLIDLHHDFKRANGYSDLEISQKRSALDNVLIPETLDTHQQRLQQAGFSHSNVWLQCLNFMSLLAWK